MWDNWRKLYVTNQQKLNVHYYFRGVVHHQIRRRHIHGRSHRVDGSISVSRSRPPERPYRMSTSPRALVLSLPRTQSWELVKIQLFSKDTLTPDIVSTELQAQSNRTAHEKKSETALFAGKKQKFKSGGNGAGEKFQEEGTQRPWSEDWKWRRVRYCHAKAIGLTNAPSVKKTRRSPVQALAVGVLTWL